MTMDQNPNFHKFSYCRTVQKLELVAIDAYVSQLMIAFILITCLLGYVLINVRRIEKWSLKGTECVRAERTLLYYSHTEIAKTKQQFAQT